MLQAGITIINHSVIYFIWETVIIAIIYFSEEFLQWKCDVAWLSLKFVCLHVKFIDSLRKIVVSNTYSQEQITPDKTLKGFSMNFHNIYLVPYDQLLQKLMNTHYREILIVFDISWIFIYSLDSSWYFMNIHLLSK